MNKRFKELADCYGFRIGDAYAMINGVWCRRPDVQTVKFKGHHIMTIPRKIHGEPNERYRTLEGTQMPMYFDLEYKLKNWNILIKRTPYIEERDKKMVEIEQLEKLYEAKGVRRDNGLEKTERRGRIRSDRMVSDKKRPRKDGVSGRRKTHAREA